MPVKSTALQLYDNPLFMMISTVDVMPYSYTLFNNMIYYPFICRAIALILYPSVSNINFILSAIIYVIYSAITSILHPIANL